MALAMRGGVSLAVWIGGAVVEIDRLRRASYAATTAEEPDAGSDASGATHFWSQMLQAAGFDTVLVDVITGASAGGLNGVLYAVSLRSGSPVDGLRRVWLEKGSMTKLIAAERGPAGPVARAAAWLIGPRAPRRVSVLDGRYFLHSLEAEVTALSSPGVDAACRQEHELSLFLAATVLGGADVVSRDDPWDDDTDRQTGAVFHFPHAGTGDALTTFTPAMTPTLAAAARTTASFPFAFEPVRWSRAMSQGTLLGPSGMLDDTPELLDGGVVDNIPVGRAIDAIVRSPAATATTRWLLYLHPSPDAKQRAAPAPLRTIPSSLVTVAHKLLGSLRNESVLDDLDVLRQQNDRARLMSAAREAAIAEGVAGAGTGRRGPDGRTDAARLYRLLSDPRLEVAWLPIGREPLVSPLLALSDDARRRMRSSIEAQVAAEYRKAITTDEPGDGSQTATSTRPPSLGDGSVRPFVPVVRTALVIADWTIDILRRQVRLREETERTVRTAKATAYAVHHAAEQLQAFLDRRTVESARRCLHVDTDVTDWLRAVLADTAALRADPATVNFAKQVTLETWLGEDGQAAETLRALAADRHEVAPDGSTPPPADDALHELWSRLAGAAIDIADALRGEPDSARARAATWQAHLERETTLAGMAALLNRIDRATLGLHAGGRGQSSSEIRYTRVSGANLTPLALRDALFPRGTRFTAPKPNLAALAEDLLVHDPAFPESLPTMDSKHKLAGDEVANFTAFLSGRWRENDWMWGQLDGAKSLLDVVLDSARLVRAQQRGGRTKDGAADELCRIVKAAVCDGPGGAPSSARNELWVTYGDAVGEEVKAFFAASGADPRGEALALTKAVLLCRRHWDILADELPKVLATPLDDRSRRPEATMSPRALDSDLLATYGAMDKDVASIWGRKWLTTIGVTAISQLLASITPPRRTNERPGAVGATLDRFAQLVFFPLKALTLAVAGLVLARTRGIAAVAFLVNLVVIPRLTPTGGGVVWLVSTFALLLLGVTTRMRRPSRSVETPPERRWHMVGELAATVAGLVAIAFGFSVWANWGDIASEHLYPNVLRDYERSRAMPGYYTVSVLIGSGTMMWLLWSWATHFRRLLAATITAAIIWGSAWVSLQRPDDDANALWSWFVRVFGSLWWGLLAAAALTVTWAIKRRPISIAHRRDPP